MSSISLIAAIDLSGGLGANNQLLCHLPADLQHFKKNTLGKPIIMGRKTFESIGRPLPGRTNIVLSHSLTKTDGITIATSLEEALSLVKEYPEIMIIGGADLFQQSIALADKLYITQIQHQFEADVYFPTIDENIWNCDHQEHYQNDEKNKYDLKFMTYIKQHRLYTT